MKLSRPPESVPSFVEFSSSISPADSFEKIPKDAVVEYIHEMCVTLSYMSNTKQCGRLTGLLNAAAMEAASQIDRVQIAESQIDESQVDHARDAVTLVEATSNHSAARKTQ